MSAAYARALAVNLVTCPGSRHRPTGLHPDAVPTPASMQGSTVRAVDSVEEEHFETLIPSRKRLRPGDIFVMKPRRRDFLFGRVIDVDAHALGDLGGAILIYVYDASSPSMDEVPELTRDRLLIPPVMMNRLGWSRGFLHTVGHRPLGPDDVLTTHCFIDRSYRAGPRYVDERNRDLPGPIEPVGQAGLASYGWLFDVIVATTTMSNDTESPA